MQRIYESELILSTDQRVYHLNLKNEHIANTVITVGDPKRVPEVSKYFDIIEFQTEKREFVTHTGTYQNKRITVISTGMGTDNIEILMNELDAAVNINPHERTVRPKKRILDIIRIGTSGAVQKNLNPETHCHLASATAIGLDTLGYFYAIPQTQKQIDTTQALQKHIKLGFCPYMFDASPKLLQKFGFDMIQGNTVTCPGFYAPQGREVRLRSKLKNFIPSLESFNHQSVKITNLEMETAGYYLMGNLLGHRVLSVNAILANRITQIFCSKPSETINQLIVKILDRI